MAFESLIDRFSVVLEPFLGHLNYRLVSVGLINDDTFKKADIKATLSELLQRLELNEGVYEAFGSVLLGMNRCQYLFNNLVSRYKISEKKIDPHHVTATLSINIVAVSYYALG